MGGLASVTASLQCCVTNGDGEEDVVRVVEGKAGMAEDEAGHGVKDHAGVGSTDINNNTSTTSSKCALGLTIVAIITAAANWGLLGEREAENVEEDSAAVKTSVGTYLRPPAA